MAATCVPSSYPKLSKLNWFWAGADWIISGSCKHRILYVSVSGSCHFHLIIIKTRSRAQSCPREESLPNTDTYHPLVKLPSSWLTEPQLGSEWQCAQHFPICWGTFLVTFPASLAPEVTMWHNSDQWDNRGSYWGASGKEFAFSIETTMLEESFFLLPLFLPRVLGQGY